MKHKKTFISKNQLRQDLEVASASIRYKDKIYKKEMEQIQSDHLALGIVAVVGYLLFAVAVVL